MFLQAFLFRNENKEFTFRSPAKEVTTKGLSRQVNYSVCLSATARHHARADDQCEADGIRAADARRGGGRAGRGRAGRRGGRGPGGERQSRGGERGRGRGSDVADAGAVGAGRDERPGLWRRVVLVVLGLP